MVKVPLSLYDFFGYLASGLLIATGVDYSLELGWVSKIGTSPVPIALFIVVTYIVGHINSNLASWLIEKSFVGKLLGNPVSILFESGSPKLKVFRWIFPGYFQGLPSGMRDRIVSQLQSRNVPQNPSIVFYHARAVAKSDPVTWGRLDTFLSLYGFCRNVSFALLSLSAVFAFSTFVRDLNQLHYAVATLIASTGMFYRYLKFYRQYSFELFTSYPDLDNVLGERSMN